MLVLTQREGDSIFIGDTIQITVSEVGHNQVRVGIAAPHDVTVHREKIYYRIHPQRQTMPGSRNLKP